MREKTIPKLIIFRKGRVYWDLIARTFNDSKILGQGICPS